MRLSVKLVVILGTFALLAVVIACGGGEKQATGGQNDAVLSLAQMESLARISAPVQVSGPGSGIWVTGRASVTVEPDLVLLTVGVRTTGETVAEARAEAVGAMEAITEAVKVHGLSERDVQTESFNIWPQHEYQEITTGEVRTQREVLVGYRVDNAARIKIRDVEAVGEIIDDVAAAGGDATRIDDIAFSVEDPTPFMSQLREDAVKDALAKAEHLAELTSVAVGDLIFIGEVGSGAPLTGGFEEGMVRQVMGLSDQATSISAGELRLSLNVQAAFSIR